jgi:hypothetical protein
VLAARLLAIVSKQNSAARSHDCCKVAGPAMIGRLLHRGSRNLKQKRTSAMDGLAGDPCVRETGTELRVVTGLPARLASGSG